MGFPLCTADATNVDTPVESDSIFCIQAEIRAIKEYLRDYGFWYSKYIDESWIFKINNRRC